MWNTDNLRSHAPRFRRRDRSSRPSRASAALESPSAEEVESELPRSLLLNLRSVACAGDIARAGLDARLRSVNRIEPVLYFQAEVVAEVVCVPAAIIFPSF